MIKRLQKRKERAIRQHQQKFAQREEEFRKEIQAKNEEIERLRAIANNTSTTFALPSDSGLPPRLIIKQTKYNGAFSLHLHAIVTTLVCHGLVAVKRVSPLLRELSKWFGIACEGGLRRAPKF